MENRRRDKRDVTDLINLGYSVLVVWECELENRREATKKVIGFLLRRAQVMARSPNSFLNASRERYRYQKRNVVRTVSRDDRHRITTRIRTRAKGDDPQSAFDYAYLRQSRRPRSLGGSQAVRVVDLFSGCGGLSLGAMEACRALGLRFVPVMAMDKDRDCIRVYNQNFKCQNVCTDDITRVLNGKIGDEPTPSEKETVERTKNVTLLLAGPPCQGNSDLNNHTRRDDPRNSLYERVARFVELLKPEHVLIENVPTAIHGKEGAVQRSIRILRRLGYAVDSGVVDLSTIGVPQRRRRHVLVASISKEVRIKEIVKMYRTARSHSVKWAIRDLQREVPDSIFERPAHHTIENKARIRYLYENNLYELPNKLRPLCHRNRRHSYKSMYGRLRPGMPAQTITSGFGSPGQGRFVHPTKRRTLTPHEAARLQFFPDFFDFSAVQKKGSLASMIGNAAPMKLSYVFALEFLG